MKYLLIAAYFLYSIGGCEKAITDDETENLAMIQAENASEFECINNQADNPPSIAVAKERMVGTWQLKSIFSMLPPKEIPNIELTINNDLSTILKKGGKVIDNGQLTLKEETVNDFTSIKISSNKEYFDNGEYGYLFGYFRVCEKEMLIDNGMMFDAPGYFFRKK